MNAKPTIHHYPTLETTKPNKFPTQNINRTSKRNNFYPLSRQKSHETNPRATNSEIIHQKIRKSQYETRKRIVTHQNGSKKSGKKRGQRRWQIGKAIEREGRRKKRDLSKSNRGVFPPPSNVVFSGADDELFDSGGRPHTPFYIR